MALLSGIACFRLGELATLTEERHFTDDDLRRIVGLAESYANEQRSLGENEVREIGQALGISEDAMVRAIRSDRAASAGLNIRNLWIESRPGAILIKSRQLGLTRNLRARLIVLGVISAIALAALVPFARSLSLAVWVLVVVLFALLIGYPAMQLLGMSEATSFLVGLPNRLVVGKSFPFGRVVAWERPLASVSARVAGIEEEGSIWEANPIYQIAFCDGTDEVFHAFRGLPKHELEHIRDRFLDWRKSEALNVSETT